MQQSIRMSMPRALATAGLFGALSLTGLALSAVPAQAASHVLSASSTPTPVDGDPVAQDGNNDSGKWGLAGLTGMVGLFGYKKYRDHRTATRDDLRPQGGPRT